MISFRELCVYVWTLVALFPWSSVYIGYTQMMMYATFAHLVKVGNKILKGLNDPCGKLFLSYIFISVYAASPRNSNVRRCLWCPLEY